MSNLKSALVIAAMMIVASPDSQAQANCLGDWISGAASLEGLVFGSNEFRAPVADDLVLTLQPNQRGWEIIMENANGDPIHTAMRSLGVTPERGNARLIQRFVFGPNILDPGQNPERIVPADQSLNLVSVEPNPGSRGSGWLIIDEQGLNGVTAGRPVYMEFQACVTWNTGPREPDDERYGNLGAPQAIASWVVTAFEDCGLPKQLLLTDQMATLDNQQRAWLEPDLDGDGRVDLVALVERENDGQTGLGICLQQDKKLSILGLDSEINNVTDSGYLSEIDWWIVDGRSFTLGIEGGSIQTIYLDGQGKFITRWEGD